MREAAEKARRIPARVAAFRRLYCNQSYEDEGDKFIPLREWQACIDQYNARGPERSARLRRAGLGSAPAT